MFVYFDGGGITLKIPNNFTSGSDVRVAVSLSVACYNCKPINLEKCQKPPCFLEIWDVFYSTVHKITNF